MWAQLTAQRLEKGSKVGVFGTGAASALALQLAEAMGLEALAVGEGPQPSEVAGDFEYVDVGEEEAMRLHTGSFDALLLASAAPIELTSTIPLVKRGGALLLTTTTAR